MAEFCYTCGAKWRTCHCTENDEIRRQEVLAARRIQHRTAADQRIQELEREAREVEEALAAIERLERQEAETAERRERERLAEEEREAQEREAQRQQAVKIHLRNLQDALARVHKHQQSALDVRHAQENEALKASTAASLNAHETLLAEMITQATSGTEAQLATLKTTHAEALSSISLRHEEEEDETFLRVTTFLRDKPNRETREKTMMEKLNMKQKEEREELERQHAEAILAVERAAGDKTDVHKEEKRRLQEVEVEAETTKELERRTWAESAWMVHVVGDRREALEALGRELREQPAALVSN